MERSEMTGSGEDAAPTEAPSDAAAPGGPSGDDGTSVQPTNGSAPDDRELHDREPQNNNPQNNGTNILSLVSPS